MTTDMSTQPARRLHLNLVAVILLMALFGFVGPAFPKERAAFTAKVVRLKGEARYSMASNQWHSINLDDLIPIGSTIQTAVGSTVDLVFQSEHLRHVIPLQFRFRPMPLVITPTRASPSQSLENALRLFENSILTIDRLSIQKTKSGIVTQTHLTLKAGRLSGYVNKCSADSEYKIKFRTGYIRPRDGLYALGASGVVYAMSGLVQITMLDHDSAVTTTILPGYRFDPAISKVLAIPESPVRPFHVEYVAEPKLLVFPSGPLLRPGI
jgi:hypothetical protein